MKKLTLVALLLAPGSAGIAATVYTDIPYRGRIHSPFYAGIMDGTTYLEDFEDSLLNTPNVNIYGGGAKYNPADDIDEDDGRIDGVSRGRYWYQSSSLGGGLPRPDNASYAFRIEFTPNAAGQYPTHAGMALFGYSYQTIISSTHVLFYGPDGEEIVPGGVLRTGIEGPGYTDPRETFGTSFVGLYSEQGISAIELSVYKFDHLQYGWGAIPEPSAGLLSGMTPVLLLFRRTRRT